MYHSKTVYRGGSSSGSSGNNAQDRPSVYSLVGQVRGTTCLPFDSGLDPSHLVTTINRFLIVSRSTPTPDGRGRKGVGVLTSGSPPESTVIGRSMVVDGSHLAYSVS